MGLPPDPSLDLERKDNTPWRHCDVNWQYPPEDPSEGCPGGWYQNHYIYELQQYLPNYNPDGSLDKSILLEGLNNWLVKKAVAYYISCAKQNNIMKANAQAKKKLEMEKELYSRK